MAKILLVDDDSQVLHSTRRLLELCGHQVAVAQDGKEALELLRKTHATYGQWGLDLVVTDVRMPHLGGIEFLKALHVYGAELPVILMTAFGQVEEAVWAMKLGAVDFLRKPVKRQELISAIDVALQRSQKEEETLGESQPVLTGSSSSIGELRQVISQVAPTEASVLICGESGSGKELVAHLIHQQSTRVRGPFVPVNCAAIPETLMESELFGHERGAFSGANLAKKGLFEAADGGTLFLDEVGDMPLALQAKLLRALQEGEIRRLGSTQSRKVDVRIVSATHQDLMERVQNGLFREDLYFRLQVVEVSIKALRDRPEDIGELALYFFNRSKKKHGKTYLQGLAPEVLERLQKHSWPGNARELSNVVERAVIFCSQDYIQLDHLPNHFKTVGLVETKEGVQTSGSNLMFPIGTPLKEMEEVMIQKTLEATQGDKNMTAKLLGINSRTIYRKLEKKQPSPSSDPSVESPLEDQNSSS